MAAKRRELAGCGVDGPVGCLNMLQSFTSALGVRFMGAESRGGGASWGRGLAWAGKQNVIFLKELMKFLFPRNWGILVDTFEKLTEL